MRSRSRRPSSRAPETVNEDVVNPYTTAPNHLHETPVERDNRLRRAREAQQRSHAIDAEIAESKKAWDRKAKAVKILLLGQAESGKSTVLKNFQIAFTPNHFARQRSAWRTVIQMNLIKSVKTILDTLQDEWGPTYTSPSPSSSSSSPNNTHRRLRMALSPLLVVDTSLTRLLSGPSSPPPWSGSGGSDGEFYSRELSVRAGSAWQRLLLDSHPSYPTHSPSHSYSHPTSNPPTSPTPPTSHTPSHRSRTSKRPRSASDGSRDVSRVVSACRGDIMMLWRDEIVRGVLRSREVGLESSSGFFLNDTARVAREDYEPTDADIVRARIRTMGVEEHRFLMESADAGSEYYIFDVGGSRGMRPQWIPYFENVDAIIFLAPLAFNQVLEEDHRVNRLEDSLCLWREVCCNRLLQHTNFILFLNKMDVLFETLASGVSVKKYVPSYGELPNDLRNVVSYFKAKFRAYHKRLSPEPRPFLCYETSAVDTQAMSAMLTGIREIILRVNLQKMAIL
ncbi:guanine nucleotide binding protein, alpha subunit [Pterulicium gracile]|uniref:Guanine nucleotide binding protein, alpha subunit n=1 Tax=Pterulicium gracile TaxID=1884261 RepID=A0A5C3QMZ8_9AGAR|nr:guanine nucleotide binding protein, alpha subunit [Pterula gracilis]